MLNKPERQVIKFQLDKEQAAINDLERQYKRALKDIEEKIKLLQSDELTQSKIYQIQYQKALRGQVEGILDKLHGDEYATIQQYLHDSYQDGFIGTMYSVHGQGIPLILPLDQNAAVKAVITDSQIKEGLYNHLGVNIKQLKQAIRQEITRGIATNMHFADIARNIANRSKAPLSRAKTIVRTEGHRIQQASANDAREAAKANGCNVVKQWDGTLDGDTRPTHRRLDGQIRETNEPFEMDGKTAMYPGDFGKPEEDCNCRCVALTRAKWALDEDELKVLKERAKFFEVDKKNDFKTFEEKYLKAAETLDKSGKTVYNKGAISGAYDDKNDPYGEKRDAHAERYYTALRNSKKSSVVEAIANNTGVDKTIISHVYDHLLVNEYELDGGIKRFDSDYNIAQSLQRLRSGRDIQEHDLILLQHEAMEYDLMHNEGMKYDEAHAKTNETYDYASALKKFLLRKDGE